VLALLGRNGAGKTTCMNTVIGWLRPRKGSVRLFGEPIERLSPEAIARKGVGLVPQGRRVFATLTVRENLSVAFRKGSSSSWNLERVFDLFPRLKERTEQHAGSLSGGEQQMLAVGRALMAGPQILLLDEPSLGLAPRVTEDILGTLALLNQEGLTIVLVEQKAPLALKLARRAYLMSLGRVIAEIDPRTVTSYDDLAQYYLA
jgi:branched-chain amino acid transport system ATP-binding protein